jgi:response regulator RpfG family c-di-GMP phosphodiesterase
MNRRVLCVDDDPNVLAGIRRGLRKRFDIDTASSGAEAVKLLETSGPYAVVLADMQMPEMNGVQLLGHAQRLAPDSVRMMLTGNADRQTPIDAVNKGHIFRFLNKPCPPEELGAALDDGLMQYSLITAERELLESTLNGCVNVLTDVLSALDPSAFGRAQQLRKQIQRYSKSRMLANAWELELAAMLSPIGYTAIPSSITKKVRDGLSLTDQEADVLVRVPEIGAKLLSNIPRLQGVAGIVHYQRKNFDGSGFPRDDVAGEDIPAGARLLRILGDAFDQTARGVNEREAFQRLQQYSGLYDTAILEDLLADLAHRSPPVPREARAVKVRELTVGMTLACDVFSVHGVLLIGSGNAITPVLLERMRNFGEVGGSGIKEPILVID